MTKNDIEIFRKKLIKVVPIEDVVGDTLTTRSYNYKYKVGDIETLVYQTHVIYYEYVEVPNRKKTLQPGIYGVHKAGSFEYELRKKDLLVEPDAPGVQSTNISDKIKIFLDNHEFFTKRGLIPKRGMLLHGPPGCGKTHSVNKCVADIVGDNGLAIYLAMDEVSVSGFVNLLSTKGISEDVDKLIIVIEDLGGGEVTDQKKGFVMPSMSDLLALLDGNSLPNKKLPTIMLSTTNYPTNFLANIIDRPGRFDEIIEFNLPDGETALAYAKSLDVHLTDFDTRSLLKGGVGLAHVKEAIVKFAVYGDAIHNTLETMRTRSEEIDKSHKEKMDPFS